MKKVMFGDIGVRPLDITDVETHTITIAGRSYKFSSQPFAHGDFSSIHIGTDTVDKLSVLLKISKKNEFNKHIERELRVIEYFQSDSKMRSGIGSYLPKIKSTGFIDGRIVVVQSYSPDFVSVAQIGQAYPGGMIPQEAAWVARRVMAQVIVAENGRLVHGAIVPDHVLVGKVSHNPIHIGWAHACDPQTQRVEMIITRWKDLYPQEVFDKKRPTNKTDIYMAGKTIEYLLAGPDKRSGIPSTVPDQFATVLSKCIEENPDRRFETGSEALLAITTAVRALWGKSYQELVV